MPSAKTDLGKKEHTANAISDNMINEDIFS